MNAAMKKVGERFDAEVLEFTVAAIRSGEDYINGISALIKNFLRRRLLPSWIGSCQKPIKITR